MIKDITELSTLGIMSIVLTFSAFYVGPVLWDHRKGNCPWLSCRAVWIGFVLFIFCCAGVILNVALIVLMLVG